MTKRLLAVSMTTAILLATGLVYGQYAGAEPPAPEGTMEAASMEGSTRQAVGPVFLPGGLRLAKILEFVLQSLF